MSKMKKLLVVLTVMVSVIAAGLVIAASTITAGKTVEVTSAQKFTAAALGKGANLGTLAKGTTAKVVKVQKDWANIKLSNSGLTGWVKVSTLKITEVKPNMTVATISKISAEWATSEHGTVPHLAYAGQRDGCIPCHSGNGFERFGTDKQYKPGDTIKSNPNDKTYTNMYGSTAELPTQIGCATCHAGVGATILKSGAVPAKLNVYTNGNVQFGGTAELKVGNANALCLTCHNGRRDAKAYYKTWTTAGVTKATSYPHHAWGALVSGQGGMEIPGVTYAQSTGHKTLGCIGCHMGKTKEGYVSHTFKPDLATCKKCHTTATDFLMGGKLKKELEDKLVELEALVVAKIPGAVKVGTDNGTAPAVNKDGVKIDVKTIESVEALVGAYNYAVIKQELDLGAKGAHNPKYARALLDESIKALKAAK